MASVPKPLFSDRDGNVGARPNEQGARNAHHPFAGAATGTRWELVRCRCDVSPDDGKISVRKLQNIWASAPAGARQCSGSVVQTKSSNKHGHTVIIIIYRVKPKL